MGGDGGRQAGTREWEDAVYFFLSEDEESAFQQALEICLRERDGHDEGPPGTERLPF
jgi:hypothetical protein